LCWLWKLFLFHTRKAFCFLMENSCKNYCITTKKPILLPQSVLIVLTLPLSPMHNRTVVQLYWNIFILKLFSLNTCSIQSSTPMEYIFIS
jgi:hypothetical protein